MMIIAETGYSMTVLSKSGRYEYFHISPFLRKKVKRFIKQKYYGKAWQLLRRFPVEKR